MKIYKPKIKPKAVVGDLFISKEDEAHIVHWSNGIHIFATYTLLCVFLVNFHKNFTEIQFYSQILQFSEFPLFSVVWPETPLWILLKCTKFGAEFKQKCIVGSILVCGTIFQIFNLEFYRLLM